MKSNNQDAGSKNKQGDSLDKALERLRDLHLNYKDLSQRCMVEIGTQNKNDKRVFYFKPDSFLLDEPEKQRQYRDKLIKKITTIPNPEPLQFMADDMHKQILETIQDRANPHITKKHLANFYKRKYYQFQHKKYKLLLRWAHHGIAQENLERIGIEATQKYAKWEYDMENAINRFERLDFDDGYEGSKTFQRPNTRAKEGGSLYVENIDLEPMSIIRQDDVEVYLRTVCYDQKINKLMTKFLARLKWLPLQARFDIWNETVESFVKVKENNIHRQEKLLEKIHSKGTAIIPPDQHEQQEEFKKILGSYYIQDYQGKIQNKSDKILTSQKTDHQLSPMMVDNILELKVRIVDKSIEYGIYGDIELDQGYSFAYQITIFFPSYFQKQIIQSQFSLYDAFAGEESDPNSVQKRNLQNMVKIDTNIFKDISTTPHNVPSQEFLNTDPSFSDIKVTRLKTCSYWIDYVCVFPKVPTILQKQAAFLSTDNSTDSLLRSAMNFLDVNDLATVNKIIEETSRLHQQQQKENAAQEKMNVKKTQDGKSNMNSVAMNLRIHFMSAIKGEMGQDTSNTKGVASLTNMSLKYLPQHLINAYYCLRHMQTRDYKIKLLYCLNYFRAIQKRMMLDLKEFGTRERIYGDQIQPYLAPNEASKQAQQNVNTQFSKSLQEQQRIQSISERYQKSTLEGADKSNQDALSSAGGNRGAPNSLQSSDSRQQSLLKQAELSEKQEKNFNTVPEGDEDKEDDGIDPHAKLFDMKQYKFKGKFCNKIYSTCPVLPRFHATFGEPVEFQPMNVEFERMGGQKHISDEGVRLLGRVDHYEIHEKTKQVFVKDDFGIYILYECAMQDMKDLEDELLKIGSYYIAKHEHLVNTECDKAYTLVDRITLLEDLLQKELDFQFEKVQLIHCYMETYEHIIDPLEQQRLIQVVVDLMATRPRLNLQSTYFQDSYDIETQCIKKHYSFLRTMIINQMRLEKGENRKLQGYLDMTLRMTHDFEKGKWKYADAEDFFNELKRRKREATESATKERGNSNMSGVNQQHGQDKSQDKESTGNNNGDRQGSELTATQKFMESQVDRQHASKYNKDTQQKQKEKDNGLNHKESEGGFAAVLGLPTITVETLYQQYKEKDEVILEIMNEHSNYMKMYEGHPDLLFDFQALQEQKLTNYKFSDWSFPINVLDFYDSVTFAHKFYATLQTIMTELAEVHKPHNYSFHAMMELKVIERCEVEYQKIKSFVDGDKLEYLGQEFLEEEAIVGNSEKIVFHIHDMMSNLDKAEKNNLNPFIISKLDLDTIAHFDFPQLGKDQNQYLRSALDKPTPHQDFDVAVKIAENNSKTSTAAQSRYFSQLKEYMRKVHVPPMLHLYCNTVELLRLRQELIAAMSESKVLEEIYQAQGKLVNRPNFKPFFTDQVKFDNYLIDSTKVNFIDDGPAAMFETDYAIKDFDQSLKSNMNFRSPDAVKMLICSSGLEEVRGLLHYQLMHKQLLIIAVRINQVVIDTHQRALNELELAKKGYSMPNSVIRVQNLFCKTGDGFSNEQYVKEKAKYANNIANNAANMFYQITLKKAKMRNSISKKFTTHLQTVATQHRKVESCLRIMRAFKIKLLHIYCVEIMRDAYFDCMKIQAISSCQRLRTMSQVFQIDESITGVLNYPTGRDQAQVFKFEDNEYFENFFCAYNPLTEGSKQAYSGGGPNPHAVKAINQMKVEIVDFAAIPSTMTLLKLDALSHEEAQELQDRMPNLLDPPQAPKSDRPEDMLKAQEKEKEEMWEEQEKFIKEILPQIEFIDPEYPQAQDGKDRISTRIWDFKQSYDYTQTQYGQIYSYYAQLERLMKFELSISKINSSLVEALQLEESIYCGLPFWAIDPEQPVNKKKQHEQQLAATKKEPAVKMSEKIIEKIYNQKRNRVNLAEEVVNLSTTIGMILNKAQLYYDQMISGKTSLQYVPIQKINEFLISHSEVKYYNLLHVIERLLDTFYLKGGVKEIKFLTELHGQIAKRDHIKVSFQHNAFHVNGAFTRPEQYSIDASNYFGYYGNYEEEQGFISCIHPTINEKALNPAQVTLFEGIYGTQVYRTTQYAGQVPHSIPGCYPMLDTAFINFNDADRRYINSTINSVRMLTIDYLDVIHKEKIPNEQFEEQVTVEQLKKCSKFLGDLCKARQLKVALMCWISRSTLPMDPEKYNYIFQQYKNDIFWKVMNKKDSLPPIGGGRPDIVIADPKAGAGGEKKAENQLLQQMQSQVLVEQVQTCKAEIWVLSNEIQRNIINAASDAIESETAAISGCFNLVATPVASHIHPFQQFASTLYSKCDPNSHLDMVTKLTEVQRFITKLNNRGTEVETLTSGPGMVFTIKDFNECLQILCRGLIKYGERSMRARSEEFAKKEAHYINLLYVKDRQIENLESRITNTQDNLDKLINSKMYEKGNQLIYELDNVNRQLRLFKDNVYLMEREIKSQLRDEFQEFFRKQQTKLDEAVFKFKQFRDDIQLDVGEEVSKRKEFITKEISKKAEEYKNKEMGASETQTRVGRFIATNGEGSSKGYHQSLEGYMEEIDSMTEIEARQELAEMWTDMRKLRIFWKAKEVLTKDKYERQIFVLKKQLTSNACLWEQLAEAEKREKVLKQELVYTQQSLAASEKVIDKLKEDLRKSESDRIRLSQYKTTKAQRLEELEGKVRKFEVMDNINLEKLIDALGSKEKQIVKLKEIESKFNEKVDQVEHKKNSEIKEVKNSYFKELGMKREVMERLEGLRMELRLLEKNEGSMTEVWKTKCKELVDICNKLKGENEGLRSKINQIAMNLSSFGGVDNDSLQQSFRQQQVSSYEAAQTPGLQLPKLMNNSAQNRLSSNINQNKYGGGSIPAASSVSGTHTRQSSIAKVLDSTILSPGDTQSRFKNDFSASKKNGLDNNNSVGKSIFNSNVPSSKISNAQTFGVMGQQTQGKGYQSTRTNVPNTPKQQQLGTENSSAVRHSVGAPSGIFGKNYSAKNGSESENTYAQQMTAKNDALGKVGLSIDGDTNKPGTALNNLEQ